MTEKAVFQVAITCPDGEFFCGQATMLELDTTEGRVGIYKHHSPELLLLQEGMAVITTPEETLEAALEQGFAKVQQEAVTILVKDARWLGKEEQGSTTEDTSRGS